MNKLLTKIISAITGLTMVIGVGFAIANHKDELEPVHAVAESYAATTLSAGKEVLIVSHDTSGNYYVMDAVTAATSAGPKYIKNGNSTFSISEGVITGDLDSHLFTVASSGSNWTFKNSSNKFLSLNSDSSNTAVRINGTNFAWTAGSASGGTLKHNNANRFLGVYTAGSDWRSYNSSGAANYSGTGTNIQFFEKTGPLPVVDSVEASIKDGDYYIGDKLHASDFNVTVNWTEGKEATHPTSGFTWTVNGVADGDLTLADNTVVVTYEEVASNSFTVEASVPPAKYSVAAEETGSSLAYSDYHKTAVVDTLDAALTEVQNNSYTAWQKNAPTSDAVYSGKSAMSYDSIQLNNPNDKKPGIVSTVSGGVASSISVTWNSNTASGRTVEIYGKNTAYSAPADLYGDAKGTLIGTIVNGTNTSLTIEAQYRYIGIKATAALYLETIDIEWQEYSYDNLAIRFTGSIEEELWNRLHSESTITGYGMLLSTETFLNGDDLKDFYDLADGSAVKNFDNTDTVHDPALKPTPTLKDGNYVWNLFKRVSLAKATDTYVAVAYILLDNDEIVFLQQESASVKNLAQDLIAGPDRDENSLGGSLNYLANL